MIHSYNQFKSLKVFIILIMLISGIHSGIAQTTLFSETFEGAGSVNTPTTTTGYNGWRKYSVVAGTSFWRISNSSARGCVLSGNWSAMMCSGAFSCHYGADDPSGYYFTSANNILYHAVTTTGYTNIKVNFKWEAGGESGADYGKVCWSTNGTTWNDLSGTYLDQTTTQTVTNLALPAGAENQATLYIGWRWRNNNNYVPEFEQGFSIDDISVTGVATCSGTPSAPVATAAANTGVNSFTAKWNASANANAYYLDVSTSNTFSSFVSGYNNRSVGNVTSFSVSGLNTGTTYYYRVRAKCSGTSGNSNTISTTTTANYCNAGPTSGTGDGITNVKFNTINNTSAINQHYADYTDISTSVSVGATYTLTVRVTTYGGMLQATQKAWIDWNQDGSFNTSTEEYNLGTATGTNVITSLSPRSITVPLTALYGDTRMRIMTRLGSSAPTSCDNFSYGEAEDYTIHVGDPPGMAYGIYAPGAITGVSDCEIYAEGGAGTAGCLVCSPSDAGYTNVNISGYPVVNATNVACTGTNITLSTAATSPDWSGSTTPLTGTGASKTIQYTSTGRKNVKLTSSAGCPAVSSTTASPGINIPDNGCSVNTYVYSTITVPDYGSCKVNTANMSIKINITHTNDADLLIYLRAPNNKLLCVSTGNGGTGDHYTNTVFSDGASINIASGSAPFTGTYKPEGSTGSAGCATPTSGVTTFLTLGGSSYNPTGNWILYVLDQASGSVGTLVNWTLTLPAATGGGTASYTYTGFTNMMMAPPSAGSITGTPSGCPGNYAYASTAAGTPGFTYSWSVSPSTGTSITSPTSSSTNITFPNTSATYTVTCNETSECCGALPAITYTTTIAAAPVAPTVSASSTTPCIGSTVRLTATAPANASFAWYDALTDGNLLATGPTYTTPAVTSGIDSFYVQAINAAGCSNSPRTLITTTGIATPLPTVSNVTRCGSGSITMDVSSPGSGYVYSWYAGSCGGTLLQSNTGISYTANVTSTTTFYVTATAPGCSASACKAVTVTVNSQPSTLTWSGSGSSGANNWFDPANWGGCLPSCISDVSIPSTLNPPDIGYNEAGSAACKNITIAATATLSFSDEKGELVVCGNVTHNGTLAATSKGILIFNGTTAQTYTKGTLASGDFNDIILNNTAGTPTLTLNNDLILGANGNFTFQNGKVITGSNNLIIKNTEASAVSGYSSSRFVQGNLRRYINTGTPTSYDFPVGHSTKGYQLANVKFTTSPSTITYLTANFNTYSSVPGALNLTECLATYNQSALNNGFWDISANNSQNNVGLYNMTLYPTNYSNAYSGFTIMSQHNGSTTWALVNGDGSNGSCVSGSVTAVERRNMKGFSKFGIAQSMTILPIELLSFDAIYNGHSTDIGWVTASETNNDYFIVERSTDAQNFSAMAKVSSKAKNGNSTSRLFYELNDPDVEKGVYYYRLKQVDFDGKNTTSSIATVVIEDHQELTVVPNPTEDISEIKFDCYSSTTAFLKVYDTKGKLVIAKEFPCSKGPNSYSLNLQTEKSGMFYIVLIVGDKAYNTKLLKQ